MGKKIINKIKNYFTKDRVIQVIIAWAIIVGIILFDQLTKLYFDLNYVEGESKEIIKGIINFTLYYNDGMAFSWLSGKMQLLAWISLIAGIALSYGIKFFDLKNKKLILYNLAITFILGGCFGNMIDRFFRGDQGVVDFIEPMFVDFAVFNVADSFLTVGAILLAIHIVFIYEEPKKKKKDEEKDENNSLNEVL